jgi:hypothetical protein
MRMAGSTLLNRAQKSEADWFVAGLSVEYFIV